MGIEHNLTEWLCRVVKGAGLRGEVITLGKQDIYFGKNELLVLLARNGLFDDRQVRVEGEQAWVLDGDIAGLLRSLDRVNLLYSRRNKGWVSDVALFRAMGFSEVRSLDVSAYEGADILFDLNNPGILEAIGGPLRRCALCVDSGTIEHVFDTAQALRNIHHLLQDDGVVVHMAPSNNYVDHGFYQFSPSFFHDYYCANGYDILAADFARHPWNPLAGPWTITPSVSEPSESREPLGPEGYRHLMCFAARKRPTSTCDVIPQQGMYRNRQDWAAGRGTG